jgi:acetyl-CoA C-acetyltransferase
MTDWTRVPVLVGAGQHTNREADPARAPDPVELMAMTAREAAGALAGADAGAGGVLAGLTHCWTVHSLSLRHSDPAGALAARIGAGSAATRCSGMGGNIPQWLVDRAAELVVAGDRPVVLIAGAEALATRRRAKRQDVHLDWPGDGGWPDTWPPLEADLGVHRAERAAGLDQATAMYALVETAIAHAAGRDATATSAAIGSVMARFNAVAAANPYSWFPASRSAAEIAGVTAENRLIFHPYPKYVNAVMDVDMAAALLLTDAQRARDWGLGPDEVVYLRGWADAHDIWYLSERPEVHRAGALARAAGAALDMAGLALDEVGAFDLYSCFPSSVEAALDALGVAADDPRPLTLTGGLPYHGGPGSNYVTHCIANALSWLRAGKGDHALVHGNGYYLTKHAVGLYSRRPPGEPPVPAEKLQDELDAAAVPVPLERSMPGPAEVVAYTAAFDRDGTPQRASLIAEAAGRRTVAVADEALTQALLAGDGVGTAVTLEARQDGPDLSRSA